MAAQGILLYLIYASLLGSDTNKPTPVAYYGKTPTQWAYWEGHMTNSGVRAYEGPCVGIWLGYAYSWCVWITDPECKVKYDPGPRVISAGPFLELQTRVTHC